MPGDNVVDEAKAIAEIVERLQARFPDSSPETDAAAVDTARETLSRAKVRDFVPVLIEKEAKAHLKGKR